MASDVKKKISIADLLTKYREDTIKLGSKIVDLKSTIAESDITTLNSKVEDFEKQIAFTEGKLAEADKVNAIISEVRKENVKLFNKIEEISKVSAPSFADIVQRERSTSRTRIIDPLKTCALVIRPKEADTDNDIDKLIAQFSKLDTINKNFGYNKPKKRKPQFIIFGINEDVTKEQLTEGLKIKNDLLKDDDSSNPMFTVNFSINTKYGANWIISVEPSIYAAIKKGRGLFFEWGFYRLDDFHSVRYCSKCGRLGHSKAKCEETPRCFKCGVNHAPDNCNKAECINCKAHNSRTGKLEKIDHLSKDRKCPLYIEAINKVIINTDYGLS
ncbi:hypothetical protein AVEN_97025-1 [Araneus ventricosus]|uniref:CCHC-type domain-containing protein n=1 Tax=Araneus ventricosus TaxID=182803 RepID=A0A4Y2FFJ4_ARAVE|nr:hypothetical protein AVEN_97025-1 [Araneus ventricosus]